MNGPSLQRLTLLSLFFHLSFFLLAFLVIKQSSRFVMPEPYVVNLVGPDVRTEETGEPRAVSQAEQRIQSPPAAREETPAVEHEKKVSKAEEKRLSDRIAALKAEKNVERIAKLRKVISLKGSGEGRPNVSHRSVGRGRSSSPDDYSAKITNDIQQNWGLPSAVTDKSLSASISIRVLKDGTLYVNRIEKSSGNTLFDRFALIAIKKSSPVTPPPYEMEIEVRFYP